MNQKVLWLSVSSLWGLWLYIATSSYPRADAGAFVCSPRERHFYWVLTSGGLHIVNRVAMESVLLHHPTACLTVYLREGMPEGGDISAFVDRFKKDGFRVNVETYSFASLLNGTRTMLNSSMLTSSLDRFVDRLEEHQAGQFWTYSHESNFLRLMVILQFGGIYLDSDIILTRPLPMWTNTIAHEMPKGMHGGTKVNNNVLIFKPGHAFLVMYLYKMLLNYNPEVYSANGPDLITEVFKDWTNGHLSVIPEADLQVLAGTTFQPVHLNHVQKLFLCLPRTPECAAYHKTIITEAYGLHLNNRVSRTFALSQGSLIHLILKQNCIFCDGMDFLGTVMVNDTVKWAYS